MFCQKCGANIPEGTKFCPGCGAEVPEKDASIVDEAKKALDNAEENLQSEIKNIGNEFNGNSQAPGGGALQTNRSLLTYIVLSIITLGIYGYWFIYKMAQDVNKACEGDGETTSGLVAFILLSFVTCGIYSLIWQYKLGNRLASNASRYNLTFQENGTTVLMWYIFGSLLCGIGPFIAMHVLIKNTNLVCIGYNRAHGYQL